MIIKCYHEEIIIPFETGTYFSLSPELIILLFLCKRIIWTVLGLNYRDTSIRVDSDEILRKSKHPPAEYTVANSCL